jgi:glycosyltransferase involved in cell wall biosynthesis
VSRRVIYLPEEPNPGRHGEVVRADTETRLRQLGIDFITVTGTQLRRGGKIRLGIVLDARGRCYWCLTQTTKLVRLMEQGQIGENDTVLFDDMFHPGFESLPYITEQTAPSQRPRIFVRCLAQSIDPDDFTFPWRRWMRPYEHLIDETVDGILIASTEMGWHLRVGMLNKAPLYVTGLPFDKHRVRASVSVVEGLERRSKRVVYASRLDAEKQPHFFLDVVERSGLTAQGVEFAIVSGFDILRSNDPSVVERARCLEAAGLLTIRLRLARQDYHEILADSQVLVITGRQDWVSNVAMEASALGTLVLAPAFRSFPETLNNSPRHMFVPWSVEDAIAKLENLLATLDDSEASFVADTQHASLDRTIDVLLGKGDRWLYRGPVHAAREGMHHG